MTDLVYPSPLRYPGGKRRLANFVKLLMRSNDLLDGTYVEPYAGGASVALALLYEEYVSRVWINDVDRGVHAFWVAALEETEAFCRLVHDTPVTIEEWRRQKAVQEAAPADTLSLGFSTFFLNRVNRSGIVTGGVIGGLGQAGPWRLDARFNKAELVRRIEKLGRFRSRVLVTNHDALDLLDRLELEGRCLLFLDPPYFVKGRRKLYTNFYEPEDHLAVADKVRSLSVPWVVSYDDVEQIRGFYSGFESVHYGLSYSASDRYSGREVMFFAPCLAIPSVEDPARVGRRHLVVRGVGTSSVHGRGGRIDRFSEGF